MKPRRAFAVAACVATVAGCIPGALAIDSSSDAGHVTDAAIKDATVIDAPAKDASVVVDAHDANPDPNVYNGHRYELKDYSTAVSWTQARDDADQAGGHLVTITTALEQSFIQSLVKNAPCGADHGAWTGGYQPSPGGAAEPRGGWAWVTGEPWSYTNWDSAEPNDLHGNEDYAFFRAATGAWNDITVSGEGKIPCALIEYDHE